MTQRIHEFLETQGGLLLMMFTGMLIFSAITLGIVIFAPANEKAFLIFSNLLTGFASSLFTAANVHKRISYSNPEDKEESQ